MTAKKRMFQDVSSVTPIISVLIALVSVGVGYYYFKSDMDYKTKHDAALIQNIENDRQFKEEILKREKKEGLYTEIFNAVSSICISKQPDDFQKAVTRFDSLYYHGSVEIHLSDYSKKQLKSFHILLQQYLNGSDVSMATIKLAATTLQKDLKYAMDQER